MDVFYIGYQTTMNVVEKETRGEHKSLFLYNIKIGMDSPGDNIIKRTKSEALSAIGIRMW
jgi:hypothetical protein